MRVRRAWRCVWGLGIAAVFMHCLVDYPMQQRPALAGWFFALMGAAAAAGTVRFRGEPEHQQHVGGTRKTFATTLMLAAKGLSEGPE